MKVFGYYDKLLISLINKLVHYYYSNLHDNRHNVHICTASQILMLRYWTSRCTFWKAIQSFFNRQINPIMINKMI